MPEQSLLVCPFCGVLQEKTALDVCEECSCLIGRGNLVLAESEMGPWWVRDDDLPFRPGKTYDIIANMARNGNITRKSIIRGPTTRQMWEIAGRVKGISHLLERCHKCGGKVKPTARSCNHCKADFYVYKDRNNLGLDQSNPSEGEVDGVSCFVSDESLSEIQSPILPNKQIEPRIPVKVDDGAGSVQFRSVQRMLRHSKRLNKMLIALLVASGITIIVLIVLLMN